jgi:hypothetical protein
MLESTSDSTAAAVVEASARMVTIPISVKEKKSR